MAELDAGHDTHDPLVIAALLDGDLTGAERATAESRIATCGSCARLHADLVALSRATRELPRPALPRDFRLTAADAARLAGTAPREPSPTATRLAGVMKDPSATRHDTHDTLLVASLADHSLPAVERTIAEALVAGCDSCGLLHADLLALQTATRALPTPPRSRDFTLTSEDATRLRPRPWRRLVAAFGTTRDGFSRPLAVGLTTLGLAGLLVGTVPSILSGQAGAATSGILGTVGSSVGQPAVAPQAAGQGEAAASDNAGGAGAASSSVPAAVGVAGSPVPSQAPLKAVGSGAPGVPAAGGTPVPIFGSDQFAGNTPAPVAAGDGAGAGRGAGSKLDQSAGASGSIAPDEEPSGASPLITVSIAFLLIGLALFSIRWTARRLGHD